MIKTLKFVAAVIPILLGAILIYATTKPDTFAVQRSVNIKASPEKIFPLISNLRAFNTWEPFSKKDPGTKIVHSGPESGKGAKYEWGRQRPSRLWAIGDNRHHCTIEYCNEARYADTDGSA